MASPAPQGHRAPLVPRAETASAVLLGAMAETEPPQALAITA